eukprot:502048-Pyramimonas_sp.AAC.1
MQRSYPSVACSCPRAILAPLGVPLGAWARLLRPFWPSWLPCRCEQFSSAVLGCLGAVSLGDRWDNPG